MAVNREALSGGAAVKSKEEYTKDVSSIVGGGSVEYANHSAPAVNTSLDVLGWTGMKITERSRRLSSDSWSSSVTVRDTILDALESHVGKKHIFISRGFNAGIGQIVPENLKSTVEIHEKGAEAVGSDAEADQQDAWTAVGVAEVMADLVGITLHLAVLDYTVSKLEFDESATILDVLSELFDMYRPRVFYAGGILYVMDRLGASLGGAATLDAKALLVEQREVKEKTPSKLKVTGASTSRSKLLKEKKTRTHYDSVYDYRFDWQGYDTEELTEFSETELERVVTTYKWGLDVDGNRQYLVLTTRSIQQRKGGDEGGAWEDAAEEITFNKYTRTSNLWEAPRIEFTVVGIAQKIWKKPSGGRALPPDSSEELNSEYGWTFVYEDGVAYTFHRYVWGDDPLVVKYVGTGADGTTAGEPQANPEGAGQNRNAPSSAANMSGHEAATSALINLWGNSVTRSAARAFQPSLLGDAGGGSAGGRAAPPSAPRAVSDSSSFNDQSLDGRGSRSGSNTTLGSGDLLAGEIITHRAILVAKSSEPFDDGGELCYVPSFKLDALTPLNEDSAYYETGGGSKAPASAAAAAAQAGGGPPSSAPSAPPGGFSDDFFDKYLTTGAPEPVWGSEIRTYVALTKDTHFEGFYSVFYDESVDTAVEHNNVTIEREGKVVAGEAPRAPVKKKRVLATWSVPLEVTLDLTGDGSTLTIQNGAIATKQDVEAVANRIAEIIAKGGKQYTTVVLTADLKPEVGWAISGTIAHPNGPTVTIGANGFLAGFSKTFEAAASQRTVQLVIESDLT